MSSKPILLVDNYDSFTHNLYQQLARLGQPLGLSVEVCRNDQHSATQLLARGYVGLVFSPGPGTPQRSGVCAELLERAQGRVPILGVCLGHQLIGQFYGAQVVRAPEPRHGKRSLVLHDGRGLFAGAPNPMQVARYHSLCVTELSEVLRATAWADDGVVMALEHSRLPIWGVQFHPESFLTQDGDIIATNFLRVCRDAQ